MRASFWISLVAAAALSACNRATLSAQTIDPQKTYQGYPCFDTCRDFQTGYDSAKKQLLSQKTACDTFAVKERLGCRAYINDLETDTLDNGGLKLSP